MRERVPGERRVADVGLKYISVFMCVHVCLYLCIWADDVLVKHSQTYAYTCCMHKKEKRGRMRKRRRRKRK